MYWEQLGFFGQLPFVHTHSCEAALPLAVAFAGLLPVVGLVGPFELPAIHFSVRLSHPQPEEAIAQVEQCV